MQEVYLLLFATEPSGAPYSFTAFCNRADARSFTQWGVHALSNQKILGAVTLAAIGVEI